MNKKGGAIHVDLLDKRDSYLSFLDEAITYLNHKATANAIKNPKIDRIRIEYFRALIYAINTANSVLKDKQIDTMEEGIKHLKDCLKKDTASTGAIVKSETLEKIENLDKQIDNIKRDGKQ